MYFSITAILAVILSNYSISGSQLKDACKTIKAVHGNIDKNYPRPNGCIMEFSTARGKCCAIGFRKVHKMVFHETFLRDKTCYRIRCRYLKGKKKKRWEKCGCKKDKIKLTQKTTLKPTTKRTTKYTTRPPSITSSPKVTTRRRPTTTTTPKPPGCLVNGVLYSYGSEIPEYSGQQDNWCYGAICGDDGNIMHWDNFNCGPSSTTPKKTTTRPTTRIPPTTTPRKTTILPPPPTTTPRKTTARPPPPTTTPKPPGCLVNGVLYPYGSEIPEYGGQQDNWCYGAICGDDGNIMHWDNFNCGPSTTTTKKTTTQPPPPTTTPRKTTTRPPPPTTTPKPPGCLVNGVLYPYGSEIPEYGGQQDNWCYGAICGDDGNIMHWDNFNCGPSTTTTKKTATQPPPPTTTPRKTTTRPPPPTTTPKPPGCLVNGVLYPYGSEIPEYGGQQDNWCYGAICGDDGNVMHWDNFNCGPSTTTPKKTTLPPTTTPPPGCFVDGKHYDEGQDIPKFYGKIDNWCYGKMCGPNGKLLSWDNFDCDKETPKTTVQPSSTKVPGCIVLGKFYKVDEDIPELFKKEGNYCISYFCNEKHELEKWEDYNCGGTTPPELLLSTPPMRMPTEPTQGGEK